jgi:hypothetical protein
MLDRGGRQLRRFAATMLAAAVIVAVFISLAVATHASTMR